MPDEINTFSPKPAKKSASAAGKKKGKAPPVATVTKERSLDSEDPFSSPLQTYHDFPESFVVFHGSPSTPPAKRSKPTPNPRNSALCSSTPSTSHANPRPFLHTLVDYSSQSSSSSLQLKDNSPHKAQQQSTSFAIATPSPISSPIRISTKKRKPTQSEEMSNFMKMQSKFMQDQIKIMSVQAKATQNLVSATEKQNLILEQQNAILNKLAAHFFT